MHSLETLVRLNNEQAEKELSRKLGHLAFTRAENKLDSIVTRSTWKALETERQRIKKADSVFAFIVIGAMGAVAFIALFLRSI